MKELEKKLGYTFNNIKLLELAMSHTSYANETRGKESNERIEYLGDAVLELISSEYIYKTYPKLPEGEMTKLRAHYVCETALYEYAKKLELNKYWKLGKGEEETGGRTRKTIVSDIFESFLGAIYLDQGIDKARKFFLENVIPHIKNHEVDFFDDYKSKLQEYVQTDKKSLEYEIIKETGPSHNKEFTSIVKIDGIIYGTGTSHSKKSAEQEAAKDALEKARERIW